MSSDYRPRGAGGSGGGSNSGGGGRRRRGGRGRSGGGHSSGGYTNEGRMNGTASSAPKKTSFIDKLLGFFGKKSKPEVKPLRTSSTPRPDFKERPPRDERRDERPKREERPKAEPVLHEIVSPKLYVGNLAYEAAESDLFDLFSKVGAVKNVEIAMDRRSNRSKGFGFVEMESLDTAKAAADKLNRTDFMGRQIVVSGAKVDKRVNSPRDEDPTAPEANPHSSNPEASA